MFLFIKEWLRTFVVKEEEGQTLVEYALILALIVIVVIAILINFGDPLRAIYSNVLEALQGAQPAAPAT